MTIRKTTRKTTEQFVAEAKQVHGDRFDYSLCEYKNTHTKLSIICNMCKNNINQTPMDHHKGRGCRFCTNRTAKTPEQFIVEFQRVCSETGNRLMLKSAYKNINTKVDLECRECNAIFSASPRNLLVAKSGCPECKLRGMRTRAVDRRLTKEQFIEQSREVHGQEYDYSLVEYTGHKNTVTILCKDHGSFAQLPSNHIHGKSGCPTCAKLKSTSHGAYSYTQLLEDPIRGSTPAIFYVIEIAYDNDRCLKVGITTRNTIKDRFQATEYRDFDIKMCMQVDCTLLTAAMLETKCLSELSDYKFFTNRKFGGYTECLQNKPEVLAKIQAILLEHS